MGSGTSNNYPYQVPMNSIRPGMNYPQQPGFYSQQYPPNPYQMNPYQPSVQPILNPSNYGLTDFETSIIQNYFSLISGIDQRLDRQEFTALIAKLYPHISGYQLQELADRAFRTIDTNGDGFINFDEFLAAYRNFKNENRSNFA